MSCWHVVISAATGYYNKETDDSQNTKVLHAESPQPTDKQEREKVCYLLCKNTITLSHLVLIKSNSSCKGLGISLSQYLLPLFA